MSSNPHSNLKRNRSSSSFNSFDRNDSDSNSDTERQEQEELVTEISAGSRIQSKKPKVRKETLIIPKLSNQHGWRGLVENRGTMVEKATIRNEPIVKRELVDDKAEEDVSENGLKYGLQVMKRGKHKKVEQEVQAVDPSESKVEVKKPKEEANHLKQKTLEEEAIAQLLQDAKDETMFNDDTSQTSNNLIIQNGLSDAKDKLSEKELYEKDIANRPEECTLDDYKRIPVTQFGSALLRGMGWKEGDPIGKSKKNALTKPIEFIPRPALLGLGATPQDEQIPKGSQKRIPKPGEDKYKVSKDYVLPTDETGKVRHYRTVDEKLVKREPLVLKEQAYVYINEGRHRTLKGQIIDLRYNNTLAVVRLKNNEEKVKVDVKDLTVISYNDYLSKTSRSKSRAASPKSTSRSSSSRPKRSWLQPHLRVRIVSKSFQDSRYYNRKGVIHDIPEPGYCNIELEASSSSDRAGRKEYVEYVPQKCLETIVPNVNGIVMILYEKMKGMILEKDKKKEKVVLQILGGENEGDVVTKSFDDVCEIVGRS
ncbi:DExH-box splicing factor binding site-domain-containing protein [Paraphysoderma sedebokerense]|nr:DExH-box splicing factor binding site-domain-containing protein [Paraphysoderma sedebokerense]